jgi:hypothetical protein
MEDKLKDLVDGVHILSSVALHKQTPSLHINSLQEPFCSSSNEGSILISNNFKLGIIVVLYTIYGL